MRTNIRLHLTYIFVIGFFVLTFLMFWVEASDNINMQKGENTFANEINILLGVIVATIGVMVRYWFSRKGGLLPKEDFMGEQPKQEVGENPPVEVGGTEVGALPHEDKRVQIVFSGLFFTGYFGLLFLLLYFQFFSSKTLVEGEESIFDILLILIGVLTVSVTQILNYWFNKDNRQELDTVSKALFDKLTHRPRPSIEKKTAAEIHSPKTEGEKVLPPTTENIHIQAPEYSQESTIIATTEAVETPLAEVTQAQPNDIQAFGAKIAEVTPMIASGIHPNLTFLLKLGGVHKATLEQISPFVADFEKRYGINTPLRRAHFYAQLAHESGNFKFTVENLNYTAANLVKVFGKYFPTLEVAEKYAKKPKAIANKVYANRMRNGSEASGDGYKYRGRGLIQITGKANYTAISNDLGIDFVSYPDLLTRPQYLLEAAGWFWSKKDKAGYTLNHYADKNDIKSITRRINGGVNGLPDRTLKFTKLKQALGI